MWIVWLEILNAIYTSIVEVLLTLVLYYLTENINVHYYTHINEILSQRTSKLIYHNQPIPRSRLFTTKFNSNNNFSNNSNSNPNHQSVLQ